MQDIDSSKSKLVSLTTSLSKDAGILSTEEDVKLKIINPVLFDILGWRFSDASTETNIDNGFADYVFNISERMCLVLEAKSMGKLNILTSENDKVRHLKLDGPVLKKCIESVKQVAAYAAPLGIPIAVVSDGSAWIVFQTFVQGHVYTEKEAYVFPSLNAVMNDFDKFYELLSKENIRRKTYSVLFDIIHNNRMNLNNPLYYPISPRDINIDRKSELAFDLDKVFESFFSRLKGDDDEELLIECFVETRESRIADYSLEKMTSRMLGNISPEHNVSDLLVKVIEEAVGYDEGESIFIVGPTGAGKTTFLDRFFRKTLSAAIRDQCITIRINCLDATGSADTVIPWMIEEMISSIEGQLFESGAPDWDQLRGLFFSEYQRRSNGVDALLYKNDRPEFLKKFSNYMDVQVESNREEYLKKLFTDIVNNRKKLPVIIVDNTDGFDIEYKEKIFQFTQSIRRNSKHCMIIYPITDKSAWSFSRTDIYTFYNIRSFFLPTPPPREIFRKRINYFKKKLNISIHKKDNKNYFTSKGIRISINNLEKFAHIIDDAFVYLENTAKIIGELSNYNIRRTMSLSRRIVTSATFDIETLILSYSSKVSSPISIDKYISALLKGDYKYYKSDDIPEIIPIFNISEGIRQSPLLQLRILSLLSSIENSSHDIEGKHISVSSIISYFEACNVQESSIDDALVTLLESHLIESFDSSVVNISLGEKLAITHKGRAHLRLARSNHIFFEQMALTTGIVNEEISDEIRSFIEKKIPYNFKYQNIRTLFAKYLIEEDQKLISTPNMKQYEIQRSLISDIENYIVINKTETLLSENFEEEQNNTNNLYKFHKNVIEGAIVVVDWYSTEKEYGFGECDEVDGQIYINMDSLKASGIQQINDGDQLLCDIRYSDKGPQIKFIHDVQLDQQKILNKNCEIVRLFTDRKYGFARPVDSKNSLDDVFFHFSIFSEVEINSLYIGQLINVEINENIGGRGPQVRRVL
tara:strand:- start:1345 stop:4290 length:2946 start_codon:yes stop_codon:yes gene_type:complete